MTSKKRKYENIVEHNEKECIIHCSDLRKEIEILQKKLKYFKNKFQLPLEPLSDQFDIISNITKYIKMNEAIKIQNLNKNFQKKEIVNFKDFVEEKFSDELEEWFGLQNDKKIEEKFKIQNINHWKEIFYLFLKNEDNDEFIYISCSCKKFEIERRDESFYQRCCNCFNGKEIEMNIKPWLHLEIDPKIPEKFQIININNWTEIYQRYKQDSCLKPVFHVIPMIGILK